MPDIAEFTNVQVIPFGLVATSPPALKDVTKKIPRSAAHATPDHGLFCGKVREVQVIPSGLVAALVVELVEGAPPDLSNPPATAQNMPSSGDHVTDDQ
jgi:hypothetical protein